MNQLPFIAILFTLHSFLSTIIVLIIAYFCKKNNNHLKND